MPAGAQTARSLITNAIDNAQLITLSGHVRPGLPPNDLGPVDDSLQLRLFLVLQRTPERQADLDNLIARQQQPTAAEYHQWLTPQQFGERFGASQQDIATLTAWLQSRGFQVNGVLHNATLIQFTATAGQVRQAFHTQLHNFNIEGGAYPALAQDPMIPAALAPVVAAIQGLNKIPLHPNHTRPRQVSYNSATHSWQQVDAEGSPASLPAYNAGGGNYFVTPQDSYTIYNVNNVFKAASPGLNDLGARATVAVIEESDIEYGSVNATTGAASGGDVATFRSLFGVPGTLNMHVYHGYGSVTCKDPGIDPNSDQEDVEASLDAEWANALAPAANLIFMSCDQSPDSGIFSSMPALIDNNLADSMSLSYGSSELSFTAADYSFLDAMYSQAAAQGQSIFISTGDSGSDVADQNTSGTATNGINVSALSASPLVTATGGTDFSDFYDAALGGPPQSTYWGGNNSAFYGNALKYVPETAWNDTCASSILANYEGYTGAGLCATGEFTFGDVIGGSGGFSTHYAAPSYQSGILGFSGSARAQPDISGFASSGFWYHALIFCDSHVSLPCTSSSTFGAAGGTSFVAPYMAGVGGLLVNYTGSRQGLLNPALYALAKAQFTAAGTKNACYSNGQTSNTGVTTGLPASSCILNDVTTSNNDMPCQAGSLSCYVNSGDSLGMLSLNGPNSLKVAYPATPGYDEVTGIGSVNVYNLLIKWNTAFTSTTALTATPNSITASQSTTLKATVTAGTPAGYVDTPPALTGKVNFNAGSSLLGNCTLSGGTCSLAVAGSALQPGANSITATFSGSGTYPASTSSVVTVTVSSSGKSQTITFNPLPNVTYGVSPITLTATASSGLPVSYSVTGPAKVSGSTLTVTGAGLVTVTASQAGNGTYAAATPVSQSFTVNKAVLTVTANNAARAAGAANPTFTYTITGFVNGDTSTVVSGTATETTSANSSSPPGAYPITFATENLTATNYSVTYVNGTLIVTSTGGIPSTPVQLIVKSSGLCLDVLGESKTPGTNTVQNTCNGAVGQQWTATPIGDGSYELTVKLDGYSLDVMGKSTTAGTPVIEYPYNGGTNEHWILTVTPDGYYNIVSQNSGLCLDISGGSTAAQAAVDQNTCSSTSSTQEWSLIGYIPTAPVQLIVKSSGLCLDTQGESTAAGSDSVQNTCNGASGQQWTAAPIGDGSYELTLQLTGYSLDVMGKSTIAGTPVIEYPYNGGSNEHWTFRATPDGYYNIVSQNSSLCLDITGGSTAAEAVVDQNTCSTSSSQKWSLTAFN